MSGVLNTERPLNVKIRETYRSAPPPASQPPTTGHSLDGPGGTVNLSNPRAIFAGSPPRFTRSRVTYEAYVVSRTSTRPQVDSAIRGPSTPLLAWSLDAVAKPFQLINRRLLVPADCGSQLLVLKAGAARLDRRFPAAMSLGQFLPDQELNEVLHPRITSTSSSAG